MQLTQAHANLFNLLMHGRFTLHGDALTAVEHQQVNTDLEFIHGRAAAVDELQKSLNDYASKNLKLEKELADLRRGDAEVPEDNGQESDNGQLC
ncbi:MAG: hypothetical protein ACW99U_16990 [Candidatus Thorarchaeota archaeon]|jgi:hypothetical protein